MSLRTFENPNLLSGVIVISRLHGLDALSIVTCENQPYFEGGQMVDHYVVNVLESSLTDEQINTALSTVETAEETEMVNDFAQAWSSYANLPQYFTYSAAELNTMIDNAWFDGMTLTEAKAAIDGAANFKVALKAVVEHIYNFRNFYVHRAVELDAYVRDCYIRPRR